MWTLVSIAPRNGAAMPTVMHHWTQAQPPSMSVIHIKEILQWYASMYMHVYMYMIQICRNSIQELSVLLSSTNKKGRKDNRINRYARL